jgi:hypothetical protein
MVEWRHRFMWFAADLAIATLAPSSSERMKERRTVDPRGARLSHSMREVRHGQTRIRPTQKQPGP